MQPVVGMAFYVALFIKARIKDTTVAVLTEGML